METASGSMKQSHRVRIDGDEVCPGSAARFEIEIK